MWCKSIISVHDDSKFQQYSILTFSLQYDLLDRLLFHILIRAGRARLVAVLILAHHVAEERDVADGQLQCVHFAQLLLVRQRRDVRAQPLERLVDALHATAFAQIGGLPLLRQLRATAAAAAAAAAVAVAVALRAARFVRDAATFFLDALAIIIVQAIISALCLLVTYIFSSVFSWSLLKPSYMSLSDE